MIELIIKLAGVVFSAIVIIICIAFLLMIGDVIFVLMYGPEYGPFLPLVETL